MGISDRRTQAKIITSCDNAFVTNILLLLSLRCTTLSHRQKHFAAATLALRFRAKNICCPETLQRSEAAHRTPPGSSALCESKASATNVFCSESKASATNVFCSESKASATNVFCSESKASATNVF
ncbi:hypothetical protein ACQKNB_15365, partial [Lysinibacillus xylanilyticus]|uniref:hypothetical protein n=1 Tax=Lysinibacillus xylanilyticus TaxID=582475 RepID=UPI003D071EAB